MNMTKPFPHEDDDSGLDEDEFFELIEIDTFVAPLSYNDQQVAREIDRCIDDLLLLKHKSKEGSKTYLYIDQLVRDLSARRENKA